MNEVANEQRVPLEEPPLWGKSSVDGIAWPLNAAAARHMRIRQVQNLNTAVRNETENWMLAKLQATKYKWSRQSIWGSRLFDFWCHVLGVAVEVDGEEHDRERDKEHDDYLYRRSAIVVIRVRNRNEEDAEAAIKRIWELGLWMDRRKAIGVKRTKAELRREKMSQSVTR